MYDIGKFYQAADVEDAVRALVEDPEAVVISGGSDVLIKIREGKLAGCSLVTVSYTHLDVYKRQVRTYLEQGIPTGLGTDVAGGAGESVFRAMADAIQVSKLRWRLVDETRKPLSLIHISRHTIPLPESRLRASFTRRRSFKFTLFPRARITPTPTEVTPRPPI